MMSTHGSAPRLHGMIELSPEGADCAVLHDRRTGFRILVDRSPQALGKLDSIRDGEVVSTLDALGLLAADLSNAEVRTRQHRFMDEQAWPERIERFRDLLQFAVETVPYYRARRADYEPSRVVDSGDLSRIPLLRRADVRSAFLSLCSERIDLNAGLESGELELVATSGTSDDRVQAISDARLVRVPSNYDEIWDIDRVPHAPRTAVLTSASCVASTCTLESSDMRARIIHEHTLYLPALRDVFAITEREVLSIATELRAFEPDFLFVNPVYAHALARRAAQLGVELPPVRVVISSYQYLSELQRRAIGAAFLAPVRALYAATELGGCQVGLECGQGRMHVREDHCLVELLDPIQRAAKQRPGLVVVSTLAGGVMPLVRYVLGDLAEATGEACSCPLWDWPCVQLHGRLKDALFIEGQWITTRQIDEIVGLERGVDFYCCTQVGEHELRFEAVPSVSGGFQPERLAERMNERWPDISVQVRIASSIIPAPSRKYPLTAREVGAPSWPS